MKLRTKFNFKSVPLFTKNPENPYTLPQHIRSGIAKILSLVNKSDIVIEVVDARTPLSGRCSLFTTYLPMEKPKLILYNKLELSEKISETKQALINEGVDLSLIIFGHCKIIKKARKISYRTRKTVSEITEKLKDFILYHPSCIPLKVMIIGNPNTGKSSLINAFRYVERFAKGETDRVMRLSVNVGKRPGITKKVTTPIIICRNPRIEVFDTPGVLPLYMNEPHVALKMASIFSLWDQHFHPCNIADYILFALNIQKKFKYVEQYSLSEPLDDVNQLLAHIAEKRNLRYANGEWDTYNSAVQLMKDFRYGILGIINLDSDILHVMPDK